ncbi:MAG: helix-hairpin-helix domain-containing protein [Pseudomonadota bacterium]
MRYPGRDQQLIIFFCALLLIVAYFLHGPYTAGPGNNLVVNNEKEGIYIEVSGDVRIPGIYKFCGEVSVCDAIERAGSLTDSLIIDEASRSVRLENGERVRCDRITEETVRVFLEKMELEKRMILSIPVDINTATEEELLAIPGLGPKIVLGIIEYRNNNGRFAAIEELRSIKGIGRLRYETIKDYFVVNRVDVS